MSDFEQAFFIERANTPKPTNALQLDPYTQLHFKVAIDEMNLYNRDVLGSPIRDIMPLQQVLACTDFLNLMKQNTFNGAVPFKVPLACEQSRPKKISRFFKGIPMPWEMCQETYFNTLGYPLGITGEVVEREDALPHQWPNLAYLCIDGYLRRGKFTKRPGEAVDAITAMTDEKDEPYPFTSGEVKLTFEQTARKIVSQKPGYPPSVSECVEPNKSYWYAFRGLPLVEVLAHTAAKLSFIV